MSSERTPSESPILTAVKTLARILERSIALLKIPPPEAEQISHRIGVMERDIILPLKAAGIAMLLYSFYFSPWIRSVLGTLDIAVESTQYFMWIYIGINLISAGALLFMHRLPLGLIQWVVFTGSLLDGLFLSALTLVTGGYQSFLYWLFPGLIIRTAVSVPRATSQLALNFTIIACYVVAGIINISIAKSLQEESAAIAAMRRPLHHAATSAAPSSVSSALSSAPAESLASHPLLSAAEIAARAPFQFSQNSEVEEAFAENSGLFGSVNDPAQPLELRLLLLVLITLCCYGVQVLLERQRMAEEEAREFAVREGQLRSAGRLAAEFAHQIKNPLAIINNAVFSLRRAAKEGKPLAHAQLEIIEEEVQKSDRIITELMGYAQLSEGRVERINVTEELDRAIAQVFPAAAAYPVKIHRDFAPNLPPLLMQRRHAAETFLNLLQNGREALDAKGGHIFVTARCRHDYAIEVTIADDGPGIAPSRQELVFEAYYTTKTKGTGLGLASVKNNVELYGGSVRVESELGKGARFVLVFPARTLIQTT